MAISKENFVFIYRLNDADSLEIANYYASKYDMDTTMGDPSVNSGQIRGVDWEVHGQLIGIQCLSTEILSSYYDFETNVILPLQEALSDSDLQDSTIWGIILGYNVPGGFRHEGNIVSSTSRVSRINHSFSLKTGNYLYNRSIFNRFDETDSDFALICSRIDGPTVDIVKNYIDKAEELNKKVYLKGKIYIDPYSDRAGPTADTYRDSILDFYNNFASSLNLDIWSTSFVDPYIDMPIPYVMDDNFVWSWFTNRGDDSFFQRTNTMRVFFYNADYDGAETIKDEDDNRWPILALNNGYMSTAGSMSKPGNDAFLNPRAFFRSLKNGGTLGEAYLFSLPYLDWTITFFGDPLASVGFPSIEEEDETMIDEHESWYKMSREAAKTAAHLYKKEQELYSIVLKIVDLDSSEKDIVISILQAAYDLYDKNDEGERISQLKPLIDKFFNYPQKRFQDINSIDNYLTWKQFKISRLLTEISGEAIISEDNLLEEGWWELEFEVTDETPSFVYYHYKINVYSDAGYSNLVIPYEINSYYITNWTYEKEKDEYSPMLYSGISSSFIGRKVRYQSRVDNLIGINEYLTRGETYYFSVTPYNAITGEEYVIHYYSDIIYS